MTIKNILDKERIKDLDEENNEDTKLKVERNQDFVREMIQDMKEERNENLGDEKNEILEEEKVEYLEVKNVGLEDKRELNEAIKHLIRPDDQNLLSKNQNKEKIELAQTNVNEVKITENENHEDEEQKADINHKKKENILQKSEREDNELLPVNEVITKENPKDFKSISKFTPFHPKMFLEEKVLLEAYEKFIGGKLDPKKIIPALEIGVIIDEIKQRFDYIKRFKQYKIDNEVNCEKNKNSTSIFFGSLEGKEEGLSVEIRIFGLLKIPSKIPNLNAARLCSLFNITFLEKSRNECLPPKFLC
uniref:Uncharacterized protein n=1 Tax=Meloidogyne enterolobii TaxID=390850 RepID=A0A6V7WUF1_MELEN|nr:unnamed protein product [Meloidogyne enterolobii]